MLDHESVDRSPGFGSACNSELYETYVGLDETNCLSFLLVQLVELEHLLIRQCDQLAVGLDSAGSDTLGKGHHTPLSSPRDDDLSRVCVVRLGNRLHQRVLEDGSAARAKRRVGLHQDTLTLAVLDQLVLRQEGMQLDPEDINAKCCQL